jgi:hypothetical protein
MRYDECGDYWRIGFEYKNDMDMSFEVRIRHHYGYDDDESSAFEVVGYMDGGEYEVLTKEQLEERIQTCLEHEDMSREQAEEFFANKVWRVDSKLFWAKVEDIAQRWNFMLYLFRPAVCY